MPLCVGKRRPDEQLNHPEPSSEQARLPTPATTRANPPAEQSAARFATRSAGRSRAHSAGRSLGDKASAEGGVSQLGNQSATTGRPGARRPCLSGPRPRVHSAHAAGLWPAPLGQHPEESDPVNPRQPCPSLRLRRPRLGSLPTAQRWRAPTRSPIAHARGHRRTSHAPMESGQALGLPELLTP